MRILYLVGGNDVIAGGATVRDAALVAGLIEAGHDVAAVSLFGPVGVEGEAGLSRVFRPLRRDTLRRLFPRLSRVPSALSTIFGRRRPVTGVTSLTVGGLDTVRGPLSVSLLSGANKLQREEFARLVEYLGPNRVPDVAIFANTLLSGLTEAVCANFGCPVVCLCQGADRVVEGLGEPYRSEARKLMRRNARLFRLVISVSRHFAIRATEFLAIPAARVKVVSPGIDAGRVRVPASRRRHPFTIGYMAPICPEKGLDVLLDAVEILARDARVKPEVWISGRVEDERYWSRMRRRLEASPLRSRHRLFGVPAGRARREFMEGLSVFVVSAREPEPSATCILEAMAAGVPVVGPSAGIVPEIFRYADGGLLVASEASAAQYAQALECIASAPDAADGMGRAGCEGVKRHFSVLSSANQLIAAIEDALKNASAPTADDA